MSALLCKLDKTIRCQHTVPDAKTRAVHKRYQHMHIAVITILVYLILVPVLGVLLNRRVENASSWATAGGSMGVVMIAAGVAGTRIGGAGTYGVAGEVIRTGLWNIWYGITTFLALALVGIFFARQYRRLKLTTIGELFLQRFGMARCAWLTSLCVQTEYFVVNVIEPLLIGVILSKVLGIELVPAILSGSAIIIVATTLSGLKGNSFANIIHCGMILLGLAAVAWIGADQLGGWNQVTSKATIALQSENIDPDRWWSMFGMGLLPIFAMFFSATIHTPATSVYVNFSSSAKSESTLVPAFLIAGLVAALMSILPVVIGIEALAKYGAHSGIGGYSNITQIAFDAGPFVGGIATAAILAALISSGGPILLASSTMVVNDWIPGSQRYSHLKKLRAYRVTSVLYGLLASLLACYFGYVEGSASVLQWLLLGFAMVVPPAIALGNIFYVRATSEAAVFWGIASGYGLGLAAWVLNKLVWQFDQDITAYVTTLVPLLVIPNISFLDRVGSQPFLRSTQRQWLLGLIGVALLAGLAWWSQMIGAEYPAVALFSVLVPAALAVFYLVLDGGNCHRRMTWGLVSTSAGALLCDWLHRHYGWFDAEAFIYLSICLPLVLFPTLALLARVEIPTDERARDFYRRLRTPG